MFSFSLYVRGENVRKSRKNKVYLLAFLPTLYRWRRLRDVKRYHYKNDFPRAMAFIWLIQTIVCRVPFVGYWQQKKEPYFGKGME